MAPAIITLGTLAFLVAGVGSYLHLRQVARWAPLLATVGGGIGILLNGAYIARSVAERGVVGALGLNLESTLLLATLLGLVALVTHLSSGLRGLDGFLYLSAAVVQLGAISVMERRPADIEYKSWFISHSLAFQVSAACFIAGGMAGLAYLIVYKTLRRKRPPTIVGSLAPLESLERFGRWALMIGFPLFTYGVLTGICEVVRAPNGPAPWFRDPLIILSFVTWAAYAVVIGAMWLRPHIRGRRFATLSASCMGLVAVVFLVVEFISPLHR